MQIKISKNYKQQKNRKTIKIRTKNNKMIKKLQKIEQKCYKKPHKTDLGIAENRSCESRASN